MKRLIIIAIVGGLAWPGCASHQSGRSPRSVSTTPQPSSTPATRPQRASTDQFKCDGRQYCSQMSSCAEATYFLKNCPDVKMDGDYDGIPCEQQWCQ